MEFVLYWDSKLVAGDCVAPSAAFGKWAGGSAERGGQGAGTGNADSAGRGPPSDHCQLGPVPAHPPQPHLVQWLRKWGELWLVPRAKAVMEGAKEGAEALWFGNVSLGLQLWNRSVGG